MGEHTYALITNGVVQQLLTTEQDISALFAPGLRWVLVANPTGSCPGCLYDGTNFTAPIPPNASASTVTLAELQEEIVTLQRAIAAFAAAQ